MENHCFHLNRSSDSQITSSVRNFLNKQQVIHEIHCIFHIRESMQYLNGRYVIDNGIYKSRYKWAYDS